ncbi:MAG: MarR family transcriptional regulator [Nitrospinae bacterium]|nr:MarR family transcriptional regulator [Nitrospinota bacterium]
MNIRLDDNIARWAAAIYRRQVALMNRRLEPYDLGSGRFPYLFFLYRQDGATLGELAESLVVDKGGATRAIDRLEKSGYVRRAPDPDDGRSVRVFLTDRGRQIRPELERVVAEVLALLVEGLSAEEQERLRSLMGRVAANAVNALKGDGTI